MDFAQLRLAESDIQFVFGKQFFQGSVKGARLHREGNQGVESLCERQFRSKTEQKKQGDIPCRDRNNGRIVLGLNGFLVNIGRHFSNQYKKLRL